MLGPGTRRPGIVMNAFGDTAVDETTISLHGGYTMRRLADDAYRALFEQHVRHCFGTSVLFDIDRALDDADRAAADALKAKVVRSEPWNFGLYDEQGTFVGWTRGRPCSIHEFTMNNSAVFPDHRRRGLYTAMLNAVLERVRAEGYHFVTSRHHANNNAVLIPKLKAGFVIRGMRISDQYGVIVELIYYLHEVRRKVHGFRAGLTAPDDDVRRVLDL